MIMRRKSTLVDIKIEKKVEKKKKRSRKEFLQQDRNKSLFKQDNI